MISRIKLKKSQKPLLEKPKKPISLKDRFDRVREKGAKWDLLSYVIENKIFLTINGYSEISYKDIEDNLKNYTKDHFIDSIEDLFGEIISDVENNIAFGEELSITIEVGNQNYGCNITEQPGCCGKAILYDLGAHTANQAKTLTDICYLILRGFSNRTSMTLVHQENNTIIKTLRPNNIPGEGNISDDGFFISDSFKNRNSGNNLVELTKHIYE